MRKILLFLASLTIFLSSFLLFQIQPLLAKRILPWFGGATAVWSTCLAFFQTFLWLGYAFAYFLNSRVSVRTQLWFYNLLLCVAIISLNICPEESWKPSGQSSPILAILNILVSSVGLPYFLLAAFSPLIQVWTSRTLNISNPYLLYSLSNFASLLALVSYPTFIEVHLRLPMQAQLWSGLFLLFTVCCLLLLYVLIRFYPETKSQHERMSQSEPVAPGREWQEWFWFLFPFCSSVFLLAMTSHISYDIATIPLLWILPLSLYLLSFILVFANFRLYPRKTVIVLSSLLLLKIADIQFTGPGASLPFSLSYSLLSFFLFCMVCHGELALLKPKSEKLASYYLLMSGGGAVGGIFVGLFSPNLFSSFVEFPLALLLFIIIVTLRIVLEFKEKNNGVLKRTCLYSASGIATLISCVVMIDGFNKNPNTIDQKRNFFGVLKVNEYRQNPLETPYRELIHGLIVHGSQYMSKEKRHIPTTYFTVDTVLGKVLTANNNSPRKIGVIGLGAGTIASYGKKGDTIRFYEIDNHVVDFAEHYFTFLRDSSAKIEVQLGDARLNLEKEEAQDYDILVLDAFSGDSIPVHLLTEQALDLYRKHLTASGVIVAHISNLYLNLALILEAYAAQKGLVFCYDRGSKISGHEVYAHYGVLAPENNIYLKNLACERVSPTSANFKIWTDDYSNLFSVLK